MKRNSAEIKITAAKHFVLPTGFHSPKKFFLPVIVAFLSGLFIYRLRTSEFARYSYGIFRSNGYLQIHSSDVAGQHSVFPSHYKGDT
jgi:hypothetical protein